MKSTELFRGKRIKDSERIILDDITKLFEAVAEKVEDSLPKGRYKALVITRLEEAHSYLIKSFTHNEYKPT